MKLAETTLTPELAAQLISSAHPNQRRPDRQTVAAYARAMREGRWQLVADPILVDRDGQMFNGGHRCAAAIASHQSIPVWISWDADPTTFDLIDIGRKRNAFQFISETGAKARASAARVTLWYERRFDRPLGPQATGFDLHELLVEVDRRTPAFDAMLSLAQKTYQVTGLSTAVALGVYAIAFDQGVEAGGVGVFVDGIVDPFTLPAGDPRRLLHERFQKQEYRMRRRAPMEDWKILVRAFNLFLDGKSVDRLEVTTLWSHVAESEADFRDRRNAAVQRARRAVAVSLRGPSAVTQKRAGS